MIPRKKKRLVITTLSALGFACALGLVFYSLGENMDMFYTPTDIVNGNKETGEKPRIGQRLRIGGLVVPGSVQRNDQDLEVTFDLMDVGPLVKVSYTGILPDLFREGQGIVAHGVLVEANKIEAFEVLAKHDEEYMSPELAEAMKGIKHQPPVYSEAAKGTK